MTRLATREAVKARQDEVQRRGRGLGWISLGLGVAQLAAPDTVRRISGVDDSRRLGRWCAVTGTWVSRTNSIRRS